MIELNSARMAELSWASSASGMPVREVAKSLLVVQLRAVVDWHELRIERRGRREDDQINLPQLPESTEGLMEPQPGESKPLAVNTNEAARLMGVSIPTMRRLMQSGEVPSFKLGGSRLVPLQALEDLVSRAERAPEVDEGDLQAG